MTFAEHVATCKQADGTFDLVAAEQKRIAELVANPANLQMWAEKVAHQERLAWEHLETALLRKQYAQPALLPELELSLKVQLGDSRVVTYGDMNKERIRLRKDLRTMVHIDENRAYDVEFNHWNDTEALLSNSETIADAIKRRGSPNP